MMNTICITAREAAELAHTTTDCSAVNNTLYMLNEQITLLARSGLHQIMWDITDLDEETKDQLNRRLLHLGYETSEAVGVNTDRKLLLISWLFPC